MSEGWEIFGRSAPGAEAFGSEFSSFIRSAVRVEMLPSYHVPSEFDAIRAFARGETLPIDFNADWLDILRSAKARGAIVKRLRVLRKVISDYLQFEINAAYRQNLAEGEEIKYIPESQFWELAGEDAVCSDFWLFDDERLYLMIYDARGSFLGTHRLAQEDVPFFRDLFSDAFRMSNDHTWAAHEYIVHGTGHR